MEVLVSKDEMTSIERMKAFEKGEELDRVPCSPIMGETCGPLFGIYPREHNHSAELMAKVEIEVYKAFKCDGAGIGTGLRGVAEAMGTELVYPADRVSYVKEPLLKCYDDLGKIKPADPHKDGRLPLILKALRMIDEEIGHEVGVSTDIAGPISVAAAIRGTENLMKDFKRCPEKAHELLQLVTESNLRFIDAACEMGYGVGFSDPVASSSMISVKQFREFAKPYLKQCIDRVAKWRGAGALLHICGKSKGIWNDMVELGISTLSIDNVESLEEARDMVGDRVCLVGNVKPVETIKMGSKEEIYEECRRCIEIGRENPLGYVLSTGCQIPLETPRENIQAMVEAARIYGKNYRKPRI
ncbi:uroporphyrinogen decarboxylase [Hathewaya proteolytica DSM 3090]|uniref:Uroporphyrinogen decarboxylase n=1 Tax=Hathewaya proteolytica DSM 3090 TaxID=1121331 RepID=A0A1M6KPH6_9CLOT|nr:uroporphyrinogen decarboxylase family protein [Hathewaya proteolytica]SHJ60830.1 uroporphyrinogen decarboxylase [Hathewaya proteolytica DSM 3090]